MSWDLNNQWLLGGLGSFPDASLVSGARIEGFGVWQSLWALILMLQLKVSKWLSHLNFRSFVSSGRTPRALLKVMYLSDSIPHGFVWKFGGTSVCVSCFQRLGITTRAKGTPGRKCRAHAANSQFCIESSKASLEQHGRLLSCGVIVLCSMWWREVS